MCHTVMPPAARRAVGRFVAIALAAVATGLAWVTGRLAHIRYIVATPFGTREITLLLTVAGTAAPRHRGRLGGLHSPFWSGTPRAPGAYGSRWQSS
jgi:hypothetical protein